MFNNQLSSLNLKNGNNSIFQTIDALSNPNLYCVDVDDPVYSAANWSMNFDSIVSFSSDCTTSISTVSGKKIHLNAYPNPTTRKLFLDLGEVYHNVNIEISNLMGQLVFSQSYNSIQSLDLDIQGPNAVYIIKIKTEDRESVIKVLKKSAH